MNDQYDNSLPKVSCLCITFARPALLEEAIQSFLNQDYRGPKELIIVNDFYLQNLSFDHPEVKIINLPTKINTLGEKRNFAASVSNGDILFPWDDDDINLSFRLSQSVAFLQNNERDYYKPTTVFFCNDGEISGLEDYHCHSQCAYTRTLFDQVLYSVMGSGEDQAFDNKVKAALDLQELATPSDAYYFYRWGGTNSYHISVMDEQGGEPALLTQCIEAVKQGQLASGDIALAPHWKLDYEAQAQAFIANQPLI